MELYVHLENAKCKISICNLQIWRIITIFASESYIYIMRKVILVLMVFMVTNHALSQSQGENVKVTLNNGKEIIGQAKSINLKESIVLTIGGIDVPIDMTDVTKIEAVETYHPLLADLIPLRKQLPDTILVTDKEEYPDTIGITIGTQHIKMRLVRGGDMLMGFDGRHSWAMCSEPVHKVSVTSFYMSDMYIREGMLEFSTYSASQSELFKDFRDSEWCSDFFDDYDDFIEDDSIIDPVGPKKGKYHVVRSIDAPYGKLDRSLSSPNLDNGYNDDNISPEDQYRHAYFRLVIKAKDYLSSKRGME